MKKILLPILSLLSLAAQAQSQHDYDNTVNRFAGYYNHHQSDSIFNMLSERAKGMMSLEKTTSTFNQLYGKLGAINTWVYSKDMGGVKLYKTDFANATLSLVVSLDNDNKMETFRFVPYQADGAAKSNSNFIFKSHDGDIYGTLEVPDGVEKMPVVLIIAGSGPTDRNGNNNMGLKTNSYAMLADSLRKHGIASVRYDKRGIGESAGAVKREDLLSFTDFMNDAIGFINMLKQDPRFTQIIVLGHSEGSLLGILAANRTQVSAFISVSGPGETLDKLLERQISAQSPERGALARKIMDSLKAGHSVVQVDPTLEDVFRPSIQPYLRSCLSIDPSREIRKLTMPVLIIQGTTDLQVSVDQAKKLHAACTQSKLEIVKGMNHTLKQAPADREKNQLTYADPSYPLCNGFVPGLVGFIKSVK